MVDSRVVRVRDGEFFPCQVVVLLGGRILDDGDHRPCIRGRGRGGSSIGVVSLVSMVSSIIEVPLSVVRVLTVVGCVGVAVAEVSVAVVVVSSILRETGLLPSNRAGSVS